MYWKLLSLTISIALILSAAALAGFEDGLVGYWTMDEGSGDVVADASGNGNDGTAQNTNWVDGIFGKALEFDGATSIVEIPYTADMTPVEGATMSAWVFPTDAGKGCVFGQFGAYGLAFFTDLQLKSVIWGDDWVMEDITVPTEEWSHIVMTWDVANAKRLIFLNGDLVAEKGEALPVPQVENALGIGVWSNWPSNWGDDFFTGIIDDVRLWNRALTLDDVIEMSQASPVESQGKIATAWGSVKSACAGR